jgi:hypothetical protein
MKLESFEFLITSLISNSKNDHSFYELGLDISNITDPYHQIITHLLRVYYGETGEDWISWYLWERKEGDEDQAWDENKNPICYDIPSLWKHIEELRVSSDFQEYVPPRKMTEEEREELLNNLFKHK